MKIYKDLEQGTPEWLELRKGTITGTKLKGVMGGPKAQLTQHYELLAEMYIDEEDLKPWEIIERGNFLEPIAKKLYEDLTGEEVEEVGFILKEQWLGLSPDGIIKKEEMYKKAIEIKCPMGKTYIKYLLEDKIPDEYFNQVINYFIVMDDLEELDFIIYNPDCSEEIKELHIINVTRSELQEDIEKANDRILKFKQKWDELNNKLLTKKIGQ